MQRFSEREIAATSSGLGHMLQSAREARFVSVNQVAHELNVQVHYLEALEQNNLGALPTGDYGRYFVRDYAAYLGLDVVEALKKYQELLQQKTNATGKTVVLNTTTKALSTHPLRRALLFFGVIGVVVYLIIAAWVTLRAPLLIVVSPNADTTAVSPDVRVVGRTRPGTEVQINGQAVAVADDGVFSLEVILQPGLNTLTIRAIKTYAKPVVLERRILYTPRSKPAPPEPSIPSPESVVK